MPVCTNCAAYVDCVYTQYSANNIRLEQCKQCSEIADHDIEQDPLNLTLDLILLKGVLIHLLYNRGSKPRHIDRNGSVVLPNVETERNMSEKRRRRTILHVGTLFVVLDSAIRWSHTHSLPGGRSEIEDFLSSETVNSFLQTLLSCLVEIALFHAGVIVATLIAFKLLDVFRKNGKNSGVEQEFRLSHVSLALLYASLTKLFLLSLLVIWPPTISNKLPSDPVEGRFGPLFHIFDDDRLNREWLLRNLMGGMASGFAVRVVLNGRPLIAAFIVVVAWSIKAGAAYVLSEYTSNIGIDRDWLIFSMP